MPSLQTNAKDIFMVRTKIVICLLATLSLFSCSKSSGGQTSSQNLPDYDFYQQTIYDVLKDSQTFEAIPFIAYVVLGIDEDSNYSRHYVHAMISDIDKKLNVISSVVYPFALIFDEKSDKLVRYYYPDPTQNYNIEELKNNFSQAAMNDFYSLPYDIYANRIEKFHATNMWNATTFYGIEEN